jgi:hypothetical protein
MPPVNAKPAMPRPRFPTVAALFPAFLLLLLWMRSGYVGDQFTLSTGGSEYRLCSDWGRVCFDVTTGPGVRPRPLTWATYWGGGAYYGTWPGMYAARHDWLVGSSLHGPRFLSTTDTYWGVQTFHPLIVALAAVPLLPAGGRSLRRLRGRWRVAKGLCRACGYDLRTRPERCPECGTAVGA